jgi:hypothetical protein
MNPSKWNNPVEPQQKQRTKTINCHNGYDIISTLYLMMTYRLSGNFANKIMGFVRYSQVVFTTLEVVESSFMSFLTHTTTLSACRLCHRTAWGERWIRQVGQKLNNLKCLLTTSCNFKLRQADLKLRLKIDREDRRREERWGETCQSKALYLQKEKAERSDTFIPLGQVTPLLVSEQSKTYVLRNGGQCVIIS